MNLTEIGNASQFNEYLGALGILKPHFEDIDGLWEFQRNNEVIARVEKGSCGRTRFFLNVQRLCKH
ncbi:MAG: hypothetical protein ACRC8D_04310 [Aeromonas sp.]